MTEQQKAIVFADSYAEQGYIDIAEPDNKSEFDLVIKGLDCFGKMVHCGECKHWWKQNELCSRNDACMDGCAHMTMHKDDFCSYGQRKEKTQRA